MSDFWDRIKQRVASNKVSNSEETRKVRPPSRQQKPNTGMGDLKVAEQEQDAQESNKSKVTNLLRNVIRTNPLSLQDPQEIIKRSIEQRPERILTGQYTTDDIIESAKTRELPVVTAV